MAKLRDALKYLGTKVNGVEPKGHYITDIIKSIADDYQGGEPTAKVTLTYALGAYGTGSVPDPVTVQEGETVQISFEDVPRYIGEGKEFVGWATTDGASEAIYTKDGTDEITMNADVTLYPVFVAEQPQPSDKLIIDNTSGAVDVIVGYADDPSPVTVSAGSTENFVFNADETFYINFVSKPDLSNSGATFTGTIGGSSYTNEDCSLDDTYEPNGAIYSPDGDWVFASGEGGTLTITSELSVGE